jgi:hypothetical protein
MPSQLGPQKYIQKVWKQSKCMNIHLAITICTPLKQTQKNIRYIYIQITSDLFLQFAGTSSEAWNQVTHLE